MSGGRDSWGWTAYGGAVWALSLLHYGVLSKFSQSDEGGLAWFRRRLKPELPKVGPGHIWVHAVSAGESKVAELLVTALGAAGAPSPVLVSSTTYSGVDRIGQLPPEQAAHFIMPLDTPAAQRRLFETLRPSLLVLVESEFWPAQFAAAEAAGVPVVVVNATLSERSLSRHRQFPQLTRATILKAARIYPQDEDTAERYRSLGVADARIEVLGNLKLAAMSASASSGERSGVTFGNVHREELETLGPAVREIAADAPVLLLPRYPGKIPADVLRQYFGPELAIVDSLEAAAGARVAWVDRMGVLAEAYRGSRIGVVCGTFAKIGGHDLSEPLQQGAAAIYGPDVTRQRALDVSLRELDAAVQVADGAELVAAVRQTLSDPAQTSVRLARFARAVDTASQRLAKLAEALAGMAEKR